MSLHANDASATVPTNALSQRTHFNSAYPKLSPTIFTIITLALNTDDSTVVIMSPKSNLNRRQQKGREPTARIPAATVVIE